MSYPPDIALQRLRDGNRRFVAGLTTDHFAATSRVATAAEQAPWAVVVGCSDSRVPTESVFDVGVGELFVVRTAGHVLAEAGLASVRFAAEKLGVQTVVVLGHEDCGAVSAALAGDAPGWLAPIVDHIDVSGLAVDPTQGASDLARSSAELLAAAVDAHVRETVASLREHAAAFDLATPPVIIGAAYQLASGEVHWLAEDGA